MPAKEEEDIQLPPKKPKKPTGPWALIDTLNGIRRKTQALAEEVGINGLPDGMDTTSLRLGIKAATTKIRNNLEIIETVPLGPTEFGKEE